MIDRTPDPSRYQFFAPSYEAGRAWFEQYVTLYGGELEQFVKPGVEGPGGIPLSMDVAWFGSRDADKVYMSLCGTHGLEYLCGLAGQLQWMFASEGQLPEDVAVCLVNAVNPYGAAWFSRTNYDNIDLNRNFRDPVSPRPENALADRVADIIDRADIDEFALYDMVEEFGALLKSEDPKEVMTAVAGGQTTNPEGIAYGGDAVSWEVSTLQEITRSYLAKARQVAIIDWHTGLGAYGEASPLFDYPAGSVERQLAEAWWGKAVSDDGLYTDGAAPVIEGEIAKGISGQCQDMGIHSVDTVVEIGTVDNDAIIPAFAIDRWLRRNAGKVSVEKAVYLRTLMMERYCPTIPAWRKAALASMKALYDQTIAGLSDWMID